MTVRAEGSTRLSRFAASFLSAVLLVPASGGFFPALAQMRVQTVPTNLGAAVTPVIGQQPGAIVMSPGVSAQLHAATGLKGVTTVLPLSAFGGTPRASVAAGSAVGAQALASGIQVVGAEGPMPTLAGAARAQSVAAAAQSGKEAPSAIRTAALAVDGEKAEQAFDGMGIIKSDKVHHPELNLEKRPEAPKANTSWNEVTIPTARALKGGVLNTIFGWVFGPDQAVVIPGNPQDEAGVERGLRELIRQRPDLFSSLNPEQFRTRHVRKVVGQAGLADTFYANFQQQKDTLAVEGSYLNFVVKVMGGKTVVVASSAELFPETSRVDTTGRLNDEQLRGKAAERLGTPPNAVGNLRDLDRKVIFIGGQWRAVQVYFYEKMMVMVAVDVNTGETFAWDPRMQAGGGSVAGRGMADGPFNKDATLDVMALAHLEIEGPAGKFYADQDGKFVVPGTGTEPVQLKMRLTGRYANVADADKKDLTVTVTAKPGEELRVVFNPEGMDEGAVAQVNAYVHTTGVHDWVVSKGIKLAALDKPMLVNVNIDDECNAYYTPWNPSLNFFKKSSKCANSSFANVNRHEYGHAVDDASGGIQNGGLSEGWGDIVAMYMSGRPEIGAGFFISNPWDPTKPPPPYLRIGTNDYKYNPRDEVHEQGLAWMGFGWKLRESLLTSLADPVKGAALAEALVLPVFLSSVKDIPSAIQQVLIRDIGEDGKSKHFKEIQAAAAAHGIKVSLPKAGQREGLFQGLAEAAMSLAKASRLAAAQSSDEAGTKNL